jgi:hypothetical protein
MSQTRFAEMDLIVDATREKEFSFAVDHLIGLQINAWGNLLDDAFFDEDIGIRQLAFVYEGGVFDENSIHES